MGLSWERSAERMKEGWSNPFGGLLSFGHALGASGLVQVNKAHHLFAGDERYLQDGPGPKRQGFRESGAVAFTTSVGGPLSHIVGSLLRGGFERLRRSPSAPCFVSGSRSARRRWTNGGRAGSSLAWWPVRTCRGCTVRASRGWSRARRT